MKQFALALAAVGLVCLAVGQASAAGALSHPMAAHVAAQYGIQHSGLPTQVKLYHQAAFHHGSHSGHHGHHWSHGPGCHHRRHYWHPPVIVRPYVAYPRPYYYYPQPYYYARPGITYRGQGFSIGIGF